MTPPRILITGATGAIGQASAAALARQGAALALVGRDPARLEDTARLVRAAGSPDVRVLRADLSRQADLHALATTVTADLPPLDVVIHNAGVIPLRRELTVDGLETQFAVNFLAPFLLTWLLLGHLAAPARIVSVASSAAGVARLDFTDLQSERRYDLGTAYARSKLALLMFSTELAARSEPARVTANALDPGWTDTPMTRAMAGGPGLLGLVNRAARVLPALRQTPERGAQGVVYLATSPEVAGITGRYYAGHHRDTPLPRPATDAALCARLWQEGLRLTGLETSV